MFTQCPECETRYRLNVGELRIGQGQIKCVCCGSIFNALNALTDSPNHEGFDEYNAVPELDESHVIHVYSAVEQQPDEIADLPWEKPVSRGSLKARFFWSTSMLFLLLLLGSQIIFFQSGQLAGNSLAGPWLSKMCNTLDCPPDIYRNVTLIDVVDHSLYPKSDQVLEFRSYIVNNAELMLPLPTVQLTLLTFTGDTMAKRVFRSDQYLPDDLSNTRMPINKRLEIKLQIVKPDSDIGGYTFKLL